jgi:pimeloyl-ACP methyl ester carboxylesterase
MVQVWAADIRFAIDKLSQMNSDARSRFQGRLDLSKIGLFGHSFGGAASVEACSADQRCKAAVDIDGNLFGDAPHEGIEKPLLFILSDWTLRPPWIQRTLASVSVQRFRRQQAELLEGPYPRHRPLQLYRPCRSLQPVDAADGLSWPGQWRERPGKDFFLHSDFLQHNIERSGAGFADRVFTRRLPISGDW